MEEKAVDKAQPKAIQNAIELAEQIQLVSGDQLDRNDAMLLGSMYQSGYFKNIDSLSKAVTRAVFGKQLGVPVAIAVASMYIVDGKPALEANAIRAQAVAAGFNIKTKELNNEHCLQEWSFKDDVLGEVEYTKTDAVRIGFIDPTCTKWPIEHNEREVSRYNKKIGRYEKVMGCDCKDNWKRVPQEMLQARCTTKGARMFANRAFNNQAVYDVEELNDSALRVDTTAIDVAIERINSAKTIDDLQALLKDLRPDEAQQLSEVISKKTQELLSDGKSTKN